MFNACCVCARRRQWHCFELSSRPTKLQTGHIFVAKTHPWPGPRALDETDSCWHQFCFSFIAFIVITIVIKYAIAVWAFVFFFLFSKNIRRWNITCTMYVIVIIITVIIILLLRPLPVLYVQVHCTKTVACQHPIYIGIIFIYSMHVHYTYEYDTCIRATVIQQEYSRFGWFQC